MQETCLPKINAKFAAAPKDAACSLVPLMGTGLSEIFVYQYRRVAAHDYGIRFEPGAVSDAEYKQGSSGGKGQGIDTQKTRQRDKNSHVKKKPLKIREIKVQEVENPVSRLPEPKANGDISSSFTFTTETAEGAEKNAEERIDREIFPHDSAFSAVKFETTLVLDAGAGS